MIGIEAVAVEPRSPPALPNALVADAMVTIAALARRAGRSQSSIAAVAVAVEPALALVAGAEPNARAALVETWPVLRSSLAS